MLLSLKVCVPGSWAIHLFFAYSCFTKGGFYFFFKRIWNIIGNGLENPKISNISYVHVYTSTINFEGTNCTRFTRLATFSPTLDTLRVILNQENDSASDQRKISLSNRFFQNLQPSSASRTCVRFGEVKRRHTSDIGNLFRFEPFFINITQQTCSARVLVVHQYGEPRTGIAHARGRRRR